MDATMKNFSVFQYLTSVVGGVALLSASAFGETMQVSLTDKEPDYEAEFDPCEDVGSDDPLIGVIRALLQPDTISDKRVSSDRFSYRRGDTAYLQSDASWTILQSIPGFEQMDALIVYRSRGMIPANASSVTARSLSGLRFDDDRAHKMVVGINFYGSDFAPANGMSR